MHGEDFVEAAHFRKILGIVEREFLPVEIADRRMRFHDDSRFVAVDARHECAVNRRDETVLQLASITGGSRCSHPSGSPKKTDQWSRHDSSDESHDHKHGKDAL